MSPRKTETETTSSTLISFKRWHLVLAALVTLFGTGGIVAPYLGAVERSKANAAAAAKHSELAAHSGAHIRMGTIEAKLDGFDGALGHVSDHLDGITASLSQLTKEAQTEREARLERENRELREQLRRARR